MFKVWKIIVLALAALLAIAKFVLIIVGCFIDKPGKAAWREGEKNFVDFFFDRCKELLKA